MTKKIKDKKKIGEVTSTHKSEEVKGAPGVGGVEAVRPAGALGGVSQTKAVRRRGTTRIMTLAERQELFRMINEEAEKMFGDNLSAEEREKVATAVKMAVDTGIAEETEED